MTQIASNNRHITLYCIENSVKAKQTLAYAKGEGVSVLSIDILKTPLTGSQIAEITNSLNLEIEDLIDRNNDLFKPKFECLNLSSEDWIKMIRQNPEIMKQPIAIWGNRTILVETPTDIIQF
jgi:arsenate reductase